MNSAEGAGVLVDAPERLVLVLAGDAAEARARRVDEDEIAGVEQAVVIVDDVVRRRRRVGVVGGDDASGPERAHVQPHRRRARSAVEQEGDRPLSRARALLEIGGVEHRRSRRRGSSRPGFLVVLVRGRGDGHVVPVLGVHDQRAGDGGVVHAAAFRADRAVGLHLVGLEVLAGALHGLLGRLVGCGGEDEGADQRGTQRQRQREILQAGCLGVHILSPRFGRILEAMARQSAMSGRAMNLTSARRVEEAPIRATPPPASSPPPPRPRKARARAGSGAAMLSRQGACAVCASERLRQPDEEAAPRSELRRADADAGAVADLVFLVEQVDHVEARGERLRVRQVERRG